MRLHNEPLGFIVNFLLGIAWGTVFLGALMSFLSFYENSFLLALISGFVGAIPGIVAILFIEHIITSKEKHLELKKQTKLLEEILNENNNKLP